MSDVRTLQYLLEYRDNAIWTMQRHHQLQREVSEHTQRALAEELRRTQRRVQFMRDDIRRLERINKTLRDEAVEQEQEPHDEQCVACMMRRPTHLSTGCGHLVFCGSCVSKRKNDLCPVCRAAGKFLKLHRPTHSEE